MATVQVLDRHPGRSAVCLILDGEFDLALRPELAWRLDEVVEHEDVRVDAFGVTFVDVGCLRLLDRARRRLEDRGGRFTIVRSSPTFELVAVLAGFSTLATRDPRHDRVGPLQSRVVGEP